VIFLFGDSFNFGVKVLWAHGGADAEETEFLDDDKVEVKDILLLDRGGFLLLTFVLLLTTADLSQHLLLAFSLSLRNLQLTFSDPFREIITRSLAQEIFLGLLGDNFRVLDHACLDLQPFAEAFQIFTGGKLFLEWVG